MNITLDINRSSELHIYNHLMFVSSSFVPALDTYVNIAEYANKLYLNSIRFEAYYNSELIGLIAGYKVQEQNSFFISNTSVYDDFNGKQVGHSLFNLLIHYCKKNSIANIKLEVFKKNERAIRFYFKKGFKEIEQTENRLILCKFFKL